MSATTLGLAALVDLATAGLLAFTGWHVLQRHPRGPALVATRAFSLWWFGLAWTLLLTAAREGAAAVGAADALGAVVVPAHATYVVALCVAVWGLLYYLLYLFTGRTGWLWPTAIGYGVVALAALALSARLEPRGLAVSKWFVGWDYGDAAAGGPFVLLTFALLLVPQLAAAIAYATVARRAEDPILRSRIHRVSLALIVWLGLSFFAPFLQLGRFEAWAAGGRIVGLAAAVVIARAFTHDLAHDATRRGRLPRAARKVDPAFAERVRSLI